MRLALTTAMSTILMIVTLGIVTVCTAHAQDRGRDGDAQSADRLFQEGRALMKKGQYTEACAKLEASYAVDAATGTLINLARCYEHLDKLASAWRHYRTVADQAAARGQTKRAAFARTRVEALEPKLARLLIRVPESSQITGLTVTRDDAVVGADDYGAVRYVDPGDYRIVAEAPGHLAFSRTVRTANGKEALVEIPKLAPGSSTGPQTGGPPSGPRSDRLLGTGASGRSDRARAGRGRRILAGSVTGVGALAVVAGLGFGWHAYSSWNQLFEDGSCVQDTLMCTPAGHARAERAERSAKTSTALLIAGGVLTATGIVLYLTAPKREAAPRHVRLSPMLGRSGPGFAVSGSF